MIRTVIALYIALQCYVAQAIEGKIVRVSTLNDYAPFFFTEQNQYISETIPVGHSSTVINGFGWQVFKESMHIMGYTIAVTVEPWARGLNNVRSNHVHLLLPAGKNALREKEFYFSQASINAIYFHMYVHNASDIRGDVFEQIQALKIGLRRKFNYGNKWLNTRALSSHPVNTIKQGFEMLNRKRIDGFLGYGIIWDEVLKTLPFKESIHKLPAFDQANEYVIASKSPENMEIIQDFDRGIERLKISGRYQEIVAYWESITGAKLAPF